MGPRSLLLPPFRPFKTKRFSLLLEDARLDFLRKAEEVLVCLDFFIVNKVESYVEPERKGTPKGDPIGFTLKKYAASLYMLTNRKQKNVAEFVGVSYGLLRKWNTEKDFRAAIQNHTREFKVYFDGVKTKGV